ncbi:MAG TPA: AI-2E family transporter [Syntrophales bacterium]|nr:AI-2E family transporter [Syntrophales bacterium]
MDTSKAQNILFFAIMIFVFLLFLYLLAPFFFPIFWAAVISSIFSPIFKLLNRKLHKPNASATIIFLMVAVIIILPGSIIGSLLLGESMRVYESLDADRGNIENIVKAVTGAVKNNVFVTQFHVDEQFWTEKVSEVAKTVSNYIFINLKDLTQNTFVFFVKFSVMLYTLFYFIRDGDKFLGKAVRVFSLGQEREKVLYERFAAAAKATLKVTLIIGGIQGTLGGLLFWLTGIQGPLMWGVVMIFTAIVPVVGCSIIWLPAGVMMMITGHLWKGVIILAFGVLVISMVDHFLRPILIGRDVQMHSLLVFLSTMGGLSLFGFTGFIIGPIIASLLLTIWAMYEEFYRGALSRD